jgi:hypothetical protein
MTAHAILFWLGSGISCSQLIMPPKPNIPADVLGAFDGDAATFVAGLCQLYKSDHARYDISVADLSPATTMHWPDNFSQVISVDLVPFVSIQASAVGIVASQVVPSHMQTFQAGLLAPSMEVIPILFNTGSAAVLSQFAVAPMFGPARPPAGVNHRFAVEDQKSYRVPVPEPHKIMHLPDKLSQAVLKHSFVAIAAVVVTDLVEINVVPVHTPAKMSDWSVRTVNMILSDPGCGSSLTQYAAPVTPYNVWLPDPIICCAVDDQTL